MGLFPNFELLFPMANQEKFPVRKYIINLIEDYAATIRRGAVQVSHIYKVYWSTTFSSIINTRAAFSVIPCVSSGCCFYLPACGSFFTFLLKHPLVSNTLLPAVNIQESPDQYPVQPMIVKIMVCSIPIRWVC